MAIIQFLTVCKKCEGGLKSFCRSRIALSMHWPIESKWYLNMIYLLFLSVSSVESKQSLPVIFFYITYLFAENSTNLFEDFAL